MHKLDIAMVTEWVHSVVLEQLPDGTQSRFRDRTASMVELQTLEQLVHEVTNYYIDTYLPHQQTKSAYANLDKGFLIPSSNSCSSSRQPVAGSSRQARFSSQGLLPAVSYKTYSIVLY
jgi:hypothetical protein